MAAIQQELVCGGQPMCCDMHASESLLAVGLITGVVQVFGQDGSAQQQPSPWQSSLATTPHPTPSTSCRAVRFLSVQNQVISGGSDKRLVLTDCMGEAGKQVWQQADAHDAGVSMLRVVSLPGAQHPLVISGDEDGGVRMWDTRTAARRTGPVMSYKQHTDYISDAALHARDGAVVVTSGDGTLSVHDVRAAKVRARSEDDADDELLSVAVLKGGAKLVAGTGSGVLAIFTWGCFNDCSDRAPGHPESVDAMIPWDDSTLLTGSSDGLVRAVGVQPNKLLGVLGAHGDLPVEALALSADRRVLASTSHDDVVRLWDLSILHDDDDDDEEEEEEEQGEEDHEEGGSAENTAAQTAIAVASSSSDDERDAAAEQIKSKKRRRRGGEKTRWNGGAGGGPGGPSKRGHGGAGSGGGSSSFFAALL